LKESIYYKTQTILLDNIAAIIFLENYQFISSGTWQVVATFSFLTSSLREILIDRRIAFISVAFNALFFQLVPMFRSHSITLFIIAFVNVEFPLFDALTRYHLDTRLSFSLLLLHCLLLDRLSLRDSMLFLDDRYLYSLSVLTFLLHPLQ